MTIQSFAFAGKGDVYLDILTGTGLPQGFRLKGECTSVEIKTESERKELIGRGLTTDGQVIASIVRPKPATIKFNFKKVDAELFAMTLSGFERDLSQGTGTVADQVVRARLGKGIMLGKLNLTDAGLSVKNSAGDATYVSGTDYTINYRWGMLTVLSGGAITDDQELKVSYGYQAISGKEVLGGTRYSIRASLFLDGENIVDETKYSVHVPRIRVSTDGSIDFLKDDFLELSMSGVIEMETGQEAPFTVMVLD